MELPFFSIIIPTYNRPLPLARCLGALAVLDYPKQRFEVIVVDDGSKVSLKDIEDRFTQRLSLKLLSQANAGPAKARNTGAFVARGEYLAFTDDDCLPATDWLQALAARFASTPEIALGGPLISALPANPFSAVSHLILSSVFTYNNTTATGPGLLVTANLALSAQQFRTLGGFDETFLNGEDREFCDRWLAEGYRLAYVPAARVYHSGPTTFQSYCKQYFGYGRGAYRFLQARANRGSGPFRPDRRFYQSFLRFFRQAYVQGENRSPALAIFLLIVWQMMNLVGFCWQGILSRFRGS